SLRRIKAAREKWVAPANAADALPGAAPGPVLLHGQDEVLAATGVKAANGGAQGPHEGLVAADQRNQHGRQDQTQPGHVTSVSRRGPAGRRADRPVSAALA